MSVPGENLLEEAMEMIAPQLLVKWYRCIARTTTGAGILLTELDDGTDVPSSSVQAVPRDKFDVLGLDMSKNYVNWFVSSHVIGVERNVAGDQIEYGTKRYQIESTTDWFDQDGWTQALCVQINNA